MLNPSLNSKTHGFYLNRTAKRTGKRTAKSLVFSGIARNAQVLHVRTRAKKLFNNLYKATLSHTCENIPCVPCVSSVHAGYTRAFTCAFTCAFTLFRAFYVFTTIFNKKQKRER